MSEALIDEFCDTLWLEDGLAKLTLEAYRRDLTQFNAWLTANSAVLQSAQPAHLQAYIQARHAAGAKAASANRRLSALKRFYRWLLRASRRQDDPTADLVAARIGAHDLQRRQEVVAVAVEVGALQGPGARRGR